MAKTQKRENVKIKKKKGFTQVQNWAPDDMTLSDKALGLYTRIQRWITFEAEDFECSKAFMRTKTPSGEKAFDSAWNELKERGYLKMYCIPPATWEAELLDEPQPDTPHTYYLNADGEVKSTNVDRAEKKKKAQKETVDKDSEYCPQKGSNTKEGEYYPQKRGNTKRSNTKRSNTKSTNTNGGKNINTPSKTSFNTSSNTGDNTNLSINQEEEENYNYVPMKEQKIGRVIDMDLINEIKNQIDFDFLQRDGKMIEPICEEDLNMAIEALAVLKTVNVAQEISGNVYAAEFIRYRADSIRADHIQYVFECFYEQREKIRNVKKYLITAIFNAPATMGAYYSNAARAKGLF